MDEGRGDAAHELAMSMTRIAHGIDRLAEQKERLRRALMDILELAEDREDVQDGEDGRPRPNDWMRVATMAREALT